VCPDDLAAAANSAFLRFGWRIRRQDQAYAPGNTAKKRLIRVICEANHTVAHTDKAAIAGGVCPVDGTGSGVIIFFEPVPKRFPRFGSASLDTFFIFLYSIYVHVFNCMETV
jgi:hypothetical protein